MKLLGGYYRRMSLCGILICLSFAGLSGVARDGLVTAECTLLGASGLDRLYDLVLRHMDTAQEWVYLDSLENEAVKEHDLMYQGLAYRNKVRFYYNKGNFDSTVFYAEKSIPFFRENSQRGHQADVESMVVNMHTRRDEYEIALIKSAAAYEEAEYLGDKQGMIVASENIAFALFGSYRERDALRWYKKALSLFKEKEGQEVNEMRMEMMVIDCLLALGEVDEAMAHLGSLRRSLASYERDCDFLQKGKVCVAEYWVWLYAYLTKVSLSKGSLDEARAYLDEAGQYLPLVAEPTRMDIYYGAYSAYYQAVGDYDQALDAEWKSAGYFSAYRNGISEHRFRLAHIYERKGDSLRSAALYQEGLALSDSVGRDMLAAQIAQFNSIYAVDDLAEEEKLRRMEVGQLSSVLTLLLALSLLLCLFVVIYLWYKRRLSDATRKAKEADVKTTAFLDSVSGEIRLALDYVAGLSLELIKTADVQEKKRCSGLIQKKNTALQQVIFNILDVSKIESGRMVFNLVRCCLSEMVSEIVGRVSRLLPPARSLVLLAAPELYVETDAQRLRQVLENLFNFMIHHSSWGNVEVEYHVDGKMVEFNLFCEGLSLRKEERALLFDRQAQAGKHLEDMGLGLVISKELVTKMGGTLLVSDKKGEGAGFTMTLPVASVKTTKI